MAKPAPKPVSRRTEPVAAAPSAPFDAQLFKAVMRKVAGTVAVFSTSGDGGLHGMTATAMCSVSADPPTILIVVNRSARTHPHIDGKKAFAVNILSDEQVAIADLFASKSNEQFAGLAYELLDDGCPVISEAAAYLHCSVQDQFDVGTHTIFVGQVIGAGCTTAPPLVYQETRYRRLAAD